MSAIKVAIRVRPSPGVANVWSIDTEKNGIQMVGGGNPFFFNRVFEPETNTYQIYQEMASEIVDSVMTGTNGTIFAYGSTGSGKTYTMMGEPENPGITPLAVDHIFKYIEDHPEREFVVGFSYFEIYNEKVRDLLKERAPADVRIKFSQKTATSAQFLTNTIIAAESNRATGSTSMNEHSSRSHAIVRIAVDSYLKGDDGVKLSSILNLVDLAGSECQKNTNAEGDRQHEASMINKSLLALSKLIDSLQNGKSIAVYRESKLTLYLQNSIGGNAQTTIICAINGEMNQKGTSEYTLRFASKAMKIKNQPKVNRIVTDKCKIEELERENRMLKQKLAEYEERMIEYEQKGVSSGTSPAITRVSTPASVGETKEVKPIEESFSSQLPKRSNTTGAAAEIPKRKVLTRNTANAAKRFLATPKKDLESDDSIDFTESIDFVPSPIQLPKREKKPVAHDSTDFDEDSEAERDAETLSRDILTRNRLAISFGPLPKRSDRKEATEHRMALITEMEQLRQQNHDLVSEKEELQNRLEDLESSYENERNEWMEEVKEIKRQAAEREAELEAAFSQDSKLTDRIREYETTISTLKGENQDVKNQLTRTEAELKGLSYTLGIVKAKMEQKDSTIIHFGKRVHAQRDELEDMNKKLEAEKKNVKDLETRNASLMSALQEKSTATLAHDVTPKSITMKLENVQCDWIEVQNQSQSPSLVDLGTMTSVTNSEFLRLTSTIDLLNRKLDGLDKSPTQESYSSKIAKVKQGHAQIIRTIRERSLRTLDSNTVTNRMNTKTKLDLILESFELAHKAGELDSLKCCDEKGPELASSSVQTDLDIAESCTEVVKEEEEEDEEEVDVEPRYVTPPRSSFNVYQFLGTVNIFLQFWIWLNIIRYIYQQ